MKFDDSMLIIIGGLVVVIVGMVVKNWFTKFIDRKFDSVYSTQDRNEKEREQDNFITMRGQQVICNCLHYLNQSVIHGDHIEELEAGNKELDKYRELLNKTILEKASRHNIKIEN